MRREELINQMQSAKNRLDFALRNFLSWELGGCREPFEAKDDLFEGQLESASKESALLAQYNLSRVYHIASRSRYLETLSYLEWLDIFYQQATQAFNNRITEPSTLHWLDVGAKNWAYVEAITAFLSAYGTGRFQLDGVEIDPHRRYHDWRTRQQYAQAYLHNLQPTLRQKVAYHAGNILNWRQPAHVITHFLPFVFQDPHLAWGLPLERFQPQAILNHLLSLLEPQGLLLIVNQGEAEAQAQEALLSAAAQAHPIQFQSLGQLPASFIDYQYPRYGWLCAICAEGHP